MISTQPCSGRSSPASSSMVRARANQPLWTAQSPSTLPVIHADDARRPAGGHPVGALAGMPRRRARVRRRRRSTRVRGTGPWPGPRAPRRTRPRPGRLERPARSRCVAVTQGRPALVDRGWGSLHAPMMTRASPHRRGSRRAVPGARRSRPPAGCARMAIRAAARARAANTTASWKAVEMAWARTWSAQGVGSWPVCWNWARAWGAVRRKSATWESRRSRRRPEERQAGPERAVAEHVLGEQGEEEEHAHQRRRQRQHHHVAAGPRSTWRWWCSVSWSTAPGPRRLRRLGPRRGRHATAATCRARPITSGHDRPRAVPPRRAPHRRTRAAAGQRAAGRAARRGAPPDAAPDRPDRRDRAERRPRGLEPPRVVVLAGRAGHRAGRAGRCSSCGR